MAKEFNPGKMKEVCEFYKIIGMRAENILRLKAVEIKPEGNAVIIEGKNAQGKSSVMAAIAMALGGKDLCPAEPIHRGAETAEVVVDLGKYLVTRRWTTNERSTIKVTMAPEKEGEPGLTIGSPQSFLDGLIGDLSFDPLKFVNLGTSPAGKRARAEILREVSGLDTKAEDEAKAKAYEERTDINRELDRREKEYDSIGSVEAPPENLRSLDDINADIRAGVKKNADIMAAKKEGIFCDEQIANCKLQIKSFEERKEKAAKLLMAEKMDIKKLEDEQTQAQGLAVNASKIERRETLAKEIKKYQKQSEEKTAAIEAAEASKAAKIAEAKIPVKGLAVTDDGADILYNKIPFDQASSSEKMRVAMAIGAAQNPKLRVLFINDASLLDKDALAEVEKFAEEKDLQCWLERVSDKKTGKGTVYIEDGEEK